MDQLTEKLIQGCRVLADDGQGDLIWGHVSARASNVPDRILMKPAGIGLEEMTRDEVITVDLAGDRIAGARPAGDPGRGPHPSATCRRVQFALQAAAGDRARGRHVL